jgi:hypothetical protein
MSAFQTGSVANHRELAETLYTFLTGDPGTVGRDWESLMYGNTKNSTTGEPFGSNCKQFVLKNIGDNETENVIIGVRCWEYSAGGAYGLDLNGYITWTTGQMWNDNHGDHGLIPSTYNSTWNRWANHPMIPLMNDTMQYWFFSNAQRVVIVVKTSSYYQSAYLGFGNRFGSPEQYPHPLLVIGCLYGNLLYSNAGTAHQFILRPYITGSNGTIMAVDPSNVYSTMKPSMGSLKFVPSSSDYSTSVFVRNDINNRKVLWPVYVVMDNQLLMALDDVFFNFSDNVSSEANLVYGGEKYMLFQNINRITHYDFMIVNTNTVGTTTTTTTTTTS